MGIIQSKGSVDIVSDQSAVNSLPATHVSAETVEPTTSPASDEVRLASPGPTVITAATDAEGEADLSGAGSDVANESQVSTTSRKNKLKKMLSFRSVNFMRKHKAKHTEEPTGSDDAESNGQVVTESKGESVDSDVAAVAVPIANPTEPDREKDADDKCLESSGQCAEEPKVDAESAALSSTTVTPVDPPSEVVAEPKTVDNQTEDVPEATPVDSPSEAPPEVSIPRPDDTKVEVQQCKQEEDATVLVNGDSIVVDDATLPIGDKEAEEQLASANHVPDDKSPNHSETDEELPEPTVNGDDCEGRQDYSIAENGDESDASLPPPPGDEEVSTIMQTQTETAVSKAASPPPPAPVPNNVEDLDRSEVEDLDRALVSESG